MMVLIVLGIVFMFCGFSAMVAGSAMNNDIEKQMESLFNNGTTNPGDEMFYVGIACLVIGVIMLVIGIVGQMNKNKQNLQVRNGYSSQMSYVSAQQDIGKDKEQTKDKEEVSQAAIIILSGPLTGAEIPLSEHQVIHIGKDGRKANVVFSGDFPNVSRLHCSISYDDKLKKYFVTDCSTNGTFYTKTKERFVKDKRTPVCMGTVISLGNDKAMIQLK